MRGYSLGSLRGSEYALLDRATSRYAPLVREVIQQIVRIVTQGERSHLAYAVDLR